MYTNETKQYSLPQIMDPDPDDLWNLNIYSYKSNYTLHNFITQRGNTLYFTPSESQFGVYNIHIEITDTNINPQTSKYRF